MDDDYRPSPQAYLARCREQLSSGTKQGLFYAAFELRCCVEARLAEYFEHYPPLGRGKGKNKFQHHKVAENQKIVNKMMIGDSIIQATFAFDDGPSIKQFYTPVPLSLHNFILNGVDFLRHTQRMYRPKDDPWWDLTRNKLVDAYRSAWVTCRGEMPLPILWDSKDNQIHAMPPPWETAMVTKVPVIIYHTDENRAVLERLSEMTDKTMTITVQRLEKPPSDWVCDF